MFVINGEQGCVMAGSRQVVFDVMTLAVKEADPNWLDTVRKGIEAFFTVERIRDTVIIALCAGLYLWLAHRVLERMVLAPMRFVIAEELRSLLRGGLQCEGLTNEAIDAFEEGSGSPSDKEQSTYSALLLLRDCRGLATQREVAQLQGPALIFAAGAVKKSLRSPVDAYLSKTTLTDVESAALRDALVRVSREQASKTAIETRLLLRRIRKSQVIGTAGTLLLVLLVVLFGNPALVAFGVLGALVSRMIAFFRSSTDSEQKYNWVVLFLVPVVGGLSAYAGVLLIDALRTWGLLGDLFTGVDFGGEHANAPTMAAAFLFGFSERLLDSVSAKTLDGLAPIMAAETSAPGGSTPNPTGPTGPTGGSGAGGSGAGAGEPGTEAQETGTAGEAPENTEKSPPAAHEEVVEATEPSDTEALLRPTEAEGGR